MSGAAAVASVTLFATLCGLGSLAVVGVARSPRDLVRWAGLAPLVGMAAAGIAGATLATTGRRLGVAGLVVLALASCGAGAARLTKTKHLPGPPPRHRPSLPLERGLAVVAAATIVTVSVAAVITFRVTPLEAYDGWAIWGTKARALALLGSAHESVFTSAPYSRLHLEYPLLFPSLLALPLQLTDGFSSNTIVLQCLAIGAAGLLAIWSLLRERVRTVLLATFLAALVAIPSFFIELSTGYADVPLAVFVAAGLVAAARWLDDGPTSFLALATVFLAAAAVTKNEGLLFAASTYVPLLVVARGRRRAVVASAAVAGLAHVPWLLYTRVHELETTDYDLSSSFDLSWVVGRLDRAPVAAAELLEQMLTPTKFGLVFLLGAAAIVLAVRRGAGALAVLAGGFVLLSLAGATWIYVLTPHDLSYFLSTNSDRVVMATVLGIAALTPLLVEESAREDL